MESKKTILITAYAVNPYKGSEDGTGWNFIYQVATVHHVIAITRENNQEDIIRFWKENTNDPMLANITFYFFDLPYWMRFWKRGPRGSGIYFYLWQWGLISFIKKLNLSFDLVHSLNFHSDSHPTFLWRLQKPLVWGPIGHHPKVPSEFMKRFGLLDYSKDRLYGWIKWLIKKCDPFIRHTASKASVILPINSDAAKYFSKHQSKVQILAAVGANTPATSQVQMTEFNLISVGRFVPMKGFDLSILSFLEFYDRMVDKEEECNVNLFLIGKGPEEDRLRGLIKNRKGEGHVKFIPWVSLKEMQDIYQRASLFLFPSHEGAGMVTVEALAYGLPVVCLDNAGPGEIVSDSCAIRVPVNGFQETCSGLANAIWELYHNRKLYDALSAGAVDHFNTLYAWSAKGKILLRLYDKVLYHEYETDSKRNIVCAPTQ